MKKTDYVLYLRKGSRTYYVAFWVNGKRIYRSTGQTDRARAEKLCKRNIARIGLPMPLEITETLFKNFSRDFFDYETSPYIKKHKGEEKCMGHDWADTCQKRLEKYLTPYWGEYQLKDITPYLINEWLDNLYDQKDKAGKDLSPATVKQIFGIFKVILDEAVKKGKMEKNPCKDDIVDKPTKTKGEKRNFLPRGTIEVLFAPENIAELWGNDKMPHYVANLLSAMTGMRLGEIMALRNEDIRGTDREPFLFIQHSYSKKYGLKDTKTKQKRAIPIHPHILNLLNEIKPASGYVFSLDGGATPIKEGIRRILYRAMRRLGISKEEREAHNVVFHSWRYYCDTILLESGIPIAGVQAITGHKTEEMTEHYSRVDARAFGRRVQSIQGGFIDFIAS